MEQSKGSKNELKKSQFGRFTGFNEFWCIIFWATGGGEGNAAALNYVRYVCPGLGDAARYDVCGCGCVRGCGCVVCVVRVYVFIVFVVWKERGGGIGEGVLYMHECMYIYAETKQHNLFWNRPENPVK